MRCHVILFEPRFAPLILSGRKCQTIRPPRKRPIAEGDELSLRCWTGRPYWSPQRVLGGATCLETSPVRVEEGGIVVNEKPLPVAELDGFAGQDGFGGFDDLRSWFQTTHQLPFDGVLFRWVPLSP